MSDYRRFKNDERGAVTVDWIVLTASVVLLAIGAINAGFKDAMLDVVDMTADMVENAMPEQ
jgi:Flp pilus assembly pilin Flp